MDDPFDIACGLTPEPQIPPAKGSGLVVLQQLTDAELKLPPPPPVAVTQEGFNIRGENSTEVVLNLQCITSLNGEKIALVGMEDIFGHTPFGGFVQKGASVPKVMADDNRVVLEMGLTHQQLADFLYYFPEASEYAAKHGLKPDAFEFNGKRFKLELSHPTGQRGPVSYSPFGDGVTEGGGSSPHKLTEVESDTSIVYTDLSASMIYRYGFYRGPGSELRLEPGAIAKMAGFKVPEKGTSMTDDKNHIAPGPSRQPLPDFYSEMLPKEARVVFEYLEKTFTSCSMPPEIHHNRFAPAVEKIYLDKKEKVTGDDILNEYLGLFCPEFKYFLSSGAVNRTVNLNNTPVLLSDVIEITLNEKFITALPIEEFKEMSISDPATNIPKLTVGEEHYFIGKYGIFHVKGGKTAFLALDGNTVVWAWERTVG